MDEVVVRSIMFIILKAFTYYFVTLQIQIFDSSAYKRYIDKDFKKFIDMADTKGESIIWRMNNKKIEKIKQHESENVKMNDMLENLKSILRKWSNQYQQEEPDQPTPAEDDLKVGQIGAKPNNASLLGKAGRDSFKEEFKGSTQTHRDLIDDLGGTLRNDKNLKFQALGISIKPQGNQDALLKKSFSKLPPSNSFRNSEAR